MKQLTLAVGMAAGCSVLHRGGNILTFLALSWVVSHAVYAPGLITR